MSNNDGKIVEIVEFALKHGRSDMLFKLSNLLERRGHMEILFKELLDLLK